jgi:hypothetical protein
VANSAEALEWGCHGVRGNSIVPGRGPKALGLSRLDLKYSAGPLLHEKLMRSIELYGETVIPLLRNLLNAT